MQHFEFPRRHYALVRSDLPVPPQGRLTLWVEAADTTGFGHEWVALLWSVPGTELRRRGYAPTAEAAEQAAFRWARAAVAGLALAERAMQEEETVTERTEPAP
jgi:hypothetical protein